MVRHTAIANPSDRGTDRVVARHKAVLVLGPDGLVEHEHGGRTIEDVEQVALVPERGQFLYMKPYSGIKYFVG